MEVVNSKYLQRKVISVHHFKFEFDLNLCFFFLLNAGMTLNDTLMLNNATCSTILYFYHISHTVDEFWSLTESESSNISPGNVHMFYS